MSKRGVLPPPGVNELADRIRDAAGAGPDEVVEVVTPTFNRSIHETPPAQPEPIATWFDALKRLRPNELKALGLCAWSGEETWPGATRLWLFPAEWYDSIPAGYEIIDISGRRERFKRGETDDDRRFGCLAFGILIDSRWIEKAPGRCGGSAVIVGTRLPVWQIVEELGPAPSTAEAAAYAQRNRVDPEAVADAIVYAAANREEIGRDIAENMIDGA